MSGTDLGRIWGIIPAGVHPWGDCCLDEVLPRALLPIVGTPIIGHTLAWLRSAAIKHVTICANSSSPAVRRAMGDGARSGVALSYYEDQTPRGPAGCLRDAALLTDADRFVIVEGTLLPRFDLSKLLQEHVRSGAKATVATCRENPSGGSNDGLVPVGVYVFERDAFDCVPATGYQDVKEVFLPALNKAGAAVVPFVVETSNLRIADASSYLAASDALLAQSIADGSITRGYRRRREGLVHIGASVSPQAQLIGRCLIGPRSEVGDGAIVVGPCVIGNDCRIEDGAVVSRSVLWNNCRIGRGTLVDNSIVTSDVDVPSEAQYFGVMLARRDRPDSLNVNLSTPSGGSSRIWDIRAVGPRGARASNGGRNVSVARVATAN